MRTAFGVKLLLLAFAVITVFFAAYTSRPVSAVSTQEIKFQGKIVNKNTGTNISPSCIINGANNDTCDFKISIYSSASGGTALWSEILTDIEIGQYNGIFSLSIGNYCITSQGGSWTTDGDGAETRCAVSSGGVNWNSDADYYIQVEFDDTNTPGLNSFSTPEVFSTRNKITTIPYALRSLTAASLIDESGVITFNDINTNTIPFSDETYTQLPDGYNSILHALTASAGGGGGLWTINGNVTYLTSSGSDLSLSSTLVSAFSVDESENLLRIGDGSSGNAKLDFYSSTGDTGRFEYIGDLLQWSGGDLRINNDLALTFGTANNIKLVYDASGDGRLEFTDGTNLLAALTDAGTTGNLTLSGVLNLGNALDNELRTSQGSAPATSNLYWGNKQICLNDGSGCSGDFTLWEALTFNSGTNTGTFENDHDVIVGNWVGDDTPLTNTSFVLDAATADDLYVVDLLGVGNSVFIENSLYLQSGEIALANSHIVINGSGISDSDSNLVLSAAGDYVVQVNDVLDITTGFITSSSVLTFKDSNTVEAIALSDESNTELPSGTNSILHALNSLAAGQSGLWTSGTGLTYLTSTGDDLAIGGNTLAATFSIDIDQNTIRLGSGSATDVVLTMYASDGDTGSITFNTNDAWAFSGGNVGIGVVNPGALLEVGGGIKISGSNSMTHLFFNTGPTGIPTIGDGFRIRTEEGYFGSTNDALIFEKTDFNNPNPDGGIVFANTGNDGVVEAALVIRGDTNNVGIGVTNPGAILDIKASTSTNPHLNLTPGATVASASRQSGDMWFDGTELSFYDGSNTYDLLAAGGLWTDAGTLTYLSSITDDFAIGGSSLDSVFSIDVSTSTFRFGSGTSSNTIFNMYASDGGTGQITYGTNDSWIFSGGSIYLQDTALRDLIIDNSTVGVNGGGNLASDSGALVFRGNYFDDSTDINTEIDINLFLDITSSSSYRLSFLNTGKSTEIASIDNMGNLQVDGVLNLGLNANDVLRIGSAADPAVNDLYWGDDLLCDVSEPNCGLTFGGGASLFTDGGTVSYLTQTTDDFAIGGSSLTAAFSVDVDLNKVRIGTGAGSDGSLAMYASDGVAGTIAYTTNHRWEFSNGDVLIADDKSLYLGSNADFYLKYDKLINDRAEFGFGANMFGYLDDIASQSYGLFNFSGITVLGSALAGSETALYINTAAGFTGKFLDIDLNGNDIFEITATGIIANVPATFASPGNVQIANNLNFTNSTASYITSESPLYIIAGDGLNDEDLILSANNAGYVIVDDRLEVTDLIHLGSNANNYLATTLQSNAATNNLYWGSSLLCNSSDANCGWGSLFTDEGSVVYLTNIVDDFAVGGTSLVASFSVDVSENLIQFGTGENTNAKLDFYASNGNTARFEMTMADILELNNAGFVFNQTGLDVDFRIAGDTDINLFFVDGGTDRVGIGVNTPDAWLDIKAATAGSAQINLTSSSGVNPSAPVSGDLWWNGTSLYFYNGTANIDLLAISQGGESLFTDSGSLTYLTSVTDDFAIGGDTLASVFSVDIDQNTVRIGSGSTTNAVLGMYSSTGTGGILVYTDNGFELSSHLLPAINDMFTLGNSNFRWSDLYLGINGIHIGTDGTEGVVSYDATNYRLGFDADADGIDELFVGSTGSLGILKVNDTPSQVTSYGQLYAKSSDGNLYYQNESGEEYKINKNEQQTIQSVVAPGYEIAAGDLVTRTGPVTIKGTLPDVNSGGSPFHPAVSTYPRVVDSDLLDTDRIVIAYSEYDSSIDKGEGKVVLGEVIETLVNYGDAHTFSSNDVDNIKVAKLATNKIVIAYNDKTTSQGMAIIGDISADSIIFGDAQMFNLGNAEDIDLVADPEGSRFVVSYLDEANSSFATAIVGSVVDSTITFGSEVVYKATPSKMTAVSGYVSGGSASNRIFRGLIASISNEYSNPPVTQTYSLDGTTITLSGTESEVAGGLDLSILTVPRYGVYGHSTYPEFWVISGQKINIFEGGYSSISFKNFTEQPLSPYGPAFDPQKGIIAAAVSNNKVVFATQRHSEATGLYISIGEKVGDEYWQFSKSRILSEGSRANASTLLSLGDGARYMILNTRGRASVHYYTTEAFSGIAKNSAVSGESIEIVVNGLVENLSGLTPNADYYVADANTYSRGDIYDIIASPTYRYIQRDILVGRSLSSTSLILESDKLLDFTRYEPFGQIEKTLAGHYFSSGSLIFGYSNQEFTEYSISPAAVGFIKATGVETNSIRMTSDLYFNYGDDPNLMYSNRGIYFGGTGTASSEFFIWDGFDSTFYVSDGLSPYVDNDSNLGTATKAWKDIYAYKYYGKDVTISSFDLAEEYEVDDLGIGAGDVVKLKNSGANLVVEKTDTVYDDGAIGVISTDPGLYLKDWKEHKENGRPVALVGRVPVKVTDENGSINRGDYLTPSSTPGYAMKATEGGIIIGRAMESFSGRVEGDSNLVQAKIEENKEQAQELVGKLVETGELQEKETLEVIEKVDEIVEHKQQVSEYKTGRILMYVDSGYVPTQYYEKLNSTEDALAIENYNIANGDNLFEITDSQLLIKSDVNIGGKIVAKRYTSTDDLILQLSRRDQAFILIDEGDNELFKISAEGKINLKETENGSIGQVSIKIGEVKEEVENSTITDRSRILVTPDQFVVYKVTKMGSGFMIEIQDPAIQTVNFDYLIIN